MTKMRCTVAVLTGLMVLSSVMCEEFFAELETGKINSIVKYNITEKDFATVHLLIADKDLTQATTSQLEFTAPSLKLDTSTGYQIFAKTTRLRLKYSPSCTIQGLAHRCKKRAPGARCAQFGGITRIEPTATTSHVEFTAPSLKLDSSTGHQIFAKTTRLRLKSTSSCTIQGLAVNQYESVGHSAQKQGYFCEDISKCSFRSYSSYKLLHVTYQRNGELEKSSEVLTRVFLAKKVANPSLCPPELRLYCSCEKICINSQMRCDGIEDCEDGTDELHCEKPPSTWFLWLLVVTLIIIIMCLIIEKIGRKRIQAAVRERWGGSKPEYVNSGGL